MYTPHSPYLRFFVDWDGNAYVVMPDDLPPDEAAHQRDVNRVLGAAFDAYEDERARIAACCAVLPDSALVLEVLDAPQGSFDGEIAYYGFDLAPLPADAGLDSVSLRAIARGPVADETATAAFDPEPDPRVAPFGYFASDQFGVGVFRWSATAQKGLARYVQDDLLGGLLEDAEAAVTVTTLYEGWVAAGAGLGDVMAELNHVTGDDSTIVWCGSFGELATGAGAFAGEVREAWRESREECEMPVAPTASQQADGPVPDDALDDFVEFLAAYGY